MVRSPMQVDESFRKRIKKIQEEIMGKEKRFESIPKITNRIIKMPEFDMIEQKLLGNVNQIEFKINFDGRKK